MGMRLEPGGSPLELPSSERCNLRRVGLLRLRPTFSLGSRAETEQVKGRGVSDVTTVRR